MEVPPIMLASSVSPEIIVALVIIAVIVIVLLVIRIPRSRKNKP
jgi:hypothetical protein